MIEKALKQAISRIAEDLEVDRAFRDELTLDRDTKGIPGSPPLFATILDKIDRATVFVPDLTFVGSRLKGEPTPNPNVLIEYGWALKSLQNKSIVAVMNEAHGDPKSLPFDLAQLRFPIGYNAPDNAPEEIIREEREKLAKRLQSAIKAVLENDIARSPKPKEPPAFSPKKPMFGESRFRSRQQPLGIAVDPLSEMLGSATGKPIYLIEGAAMWLRFMPVNDPGQEWRVQEIKTRAMPLAIAPLIPSGGGIGFLRSEDGGGFYRVTDNDTTPAVSYVFRTGEIWIINAWFALTAPAFEFDENKFVQTIERCVEFLENLGIQEPYRWVVGIEGILNRKLYVPNGNRVWGPCLGDKIEYNGQYRKGDNIDKMLRPFFENVFDQCGGQRPSQT